MELERRRNANGNVALKKDLKIGRWWCYRLAIVATLAGCSGSSATYPVTGTVKFSNGQPLAGGRVLFQPTSEPSQPAKATIAADGTFSLGTFGIEDGAVPGHHRVAVYPRVPPEAGNDMAAIARYRSVVDSRLQNIQTTPLEFTVKSDGSGNHFDIQLKPTGAEKKNN
jgi:hypothetical protein